MTPYTLTIYLKLEKQKNLYFHCLKYLHIEDFSPPCPLTMDHLTYFSRTKNVCLPSRAWELNILKKENNFQKVEFWPPNSQILGFDSVFHYLVTIFNKLNFFLQ